MIQGELVNLRAVDLDDSPVVHRWLNNPAVMDGWGDAAATVSRSGVTRKIVRWLEDEEQLGRPVGFIIERLDDEPVGMLLGVPSERDERTVQLSLLIGSVDQWGQGLGGDALDAWLQAAFDEWNLRRVWLEVEAGNERAERLYRSAGFEREARLRDARYRHGRFEDVLRFGLTNTMWDAMHRPQEAPKAQDPGELFDVVTAEGEPTGIVKPRWQVHRDGDWHRSIHLWIYGIDGGVAYLDFQRRGMEKDTFPGRLDATVAGHLGAGESVHDALREVNEEAGITISEVDTVEAGVRISANEGNGRAIDRELQQLFLVRRDEPLTSYRPNPDEVAAIIRIALDDAIALLNGDTPEAAGISFDASGMLERVLVDRNQFIPSVDRYFLRVALAARRSLAGEIPVVV